MPYTDQTLMAYADGELDDETRRAVHDAIASDPALAERVRRHELLRSRLAAAYDPVLAEPVPERLLDALLGVQGAAQPSSKVVDIGIAQRAKERTAASRRWSWPEWSAMAACLMVGVFAGQMGVSSLLDSAAFETRAGHLVARGSLERALTTHSAGTSATQGSTSVVMSFVSSSGEYCRGFTVRQDAALAGLACRVDDEWRVQVLAEDAAPASGYRQAGSALPSVVLRAVDERMQGNPLDAKAEQAAIAQRWRR